MLPIHESEMPEVKDSLKAKVNHLYQGPEPVQWPEQGRLCVCTGFCPVQPRSSVHFKTIQILGFFSLHLLPAFWQLPYSFVAP